MMSRAHHSPRSGSICSIANEATVEPVTVETFVPSSVVAKSCSGRDLNQRTRCALRSPSLLSRSSSSAFYEMIESSAAAKNASDIKQRRTIAHAPELRINHAQLPRFRALLMRRRWDKNLQVNLPLYKFQWLCPLNRLQPYEASIFRSLRRAALVWLVKEQWSTPQCLDSLRCDVPPRHRNLWADDSVTRRGSVRHVGRRLNWWFR